MKIIPHPQPGNHIDLSITAGLGRTNPQGTRISIPVRGTSLARALAEALTPDPEEPIPEEGWWSQHGWAGNRRGTARWRGACGVVLDIDHYDHQGTHSKPSTGEVSVPASIIHRTPRGLRAVFVFDESETDRGRMRAAMRGAAYVAETALAQQGLLGRFESGQPRDGYVVDVGASFDLARLYWAPRCRVDGVDRDADLLVLRDAPYRAQDLARLGSRWRR